MKRQLFLIPLVAFFAACATDDLGMGETPSNPMADVDPLTVPLDDALGEMYSLMNDIYGASTRAAQRTVADVATFSTPSALTRSGEEPRQLAYVVNFAGGGFAVLGARATVPSVLCITDSGEFTAAEVERISREIGNPSADYLGVTAGTRASIYSIDDLWTPFSAMEDYEYDSADDPEPDGGEYLIGSSDESFVKEQVLITTFICDIVPDLIIDGEGNPIIAGGSPGTTKYGSWTEKAGTKKGPLLETRWGQNTPFNDNNSDDTAAGCVPVAVAQIIAWNEKPSLPSQICPTITSTWDELKSWRPVGTAITDRTRIERDLATLLAGIGQGVHARYGIFGSSETFAWPSAAKKFMKKRLGYNNARKRVGYKEGVIKDMVVTKGKPVFIAGIDRNWGGAHAWVIDGYMEQTRTITKPTSTSTETRKLMHCNFGWQGDCDGYYVSDVFDLDEGPVETEDGDIESDDYNSHFNWWYRIIEY